MTPQPPILQTILPLVKSYGHNKAIAWLEGDEELGIADDDLCSFLARQGVDFDSLLTAYQDQIRDLYLETVKTVMSQRLANASQIGQDASLGHFLPICVANEVGGVQGVPEAPAGLSLVSPEPFGKPEGPSSSPCAGSGAAVTDVPPLGEVEKTQRGFEVLTFEDRGMADCTLQQSSVADFEPPGTSAVWLGIATQERMHLSLSHVQSLIAHLQAWLQTGSFVLSPPSPEKPVVQPTPSDPAGLLEECREALERVLSGPKPYTYTEQAAWDSARKVLKKLNA